MTLQNAVVLERAADLVAEGWGQGAFFDLKGRVCLEEAIRQSSVQQTRGPARSAIRRLLFGAPRKGNLILWNDAPGRTQAEVVAVLREAAVRERGQQ